MNNTINLKEFKENSKEWFLEKLSNMSEPQVYSTIGRIYKELHEKELPKNYNECCKTLNTFWTRSVIPGYRGALIADYQELLFCRDAYWDIAGFKMGLGKPWKPDYKNPDIDLYAIINVYNRVEKSNHGYGFESHVLTFPTEQMRDIFYKNFKDLIERCKELI